MPTQLRLTPGKLPQGQCWTTPELMIPVLARSLFVQLPDDGSFFTVSATEPPPDKRSSPWVKLDNLGRPLGWYFFYKNYWRRIPAHSVGQIVLYDGASTVFDDTGLAKPGGDWDGYALCNGNNGTPDLRDRFVVGANVQESSVWKTKLESDTAVQKGGKVGYKVVWDDLPPRDLSADGTLKNATGVEDPNNQEVLRTRYVIRANPKGALPLSEQTALPQPPYFALAYTKFVGFN